jgi:hypothetical protein
VGGKTSLSVSSLSYPFVLAPVDWEGANQIPFDGFVMTKAGTINTQPVSMLRERIRSVGISLLGGNSGVEGPYELGIDEIRAVNEEDVTVLPRKLAISFQVEGVTKVTWPRQSKIQCGDQYNLFSFHGNLFPFLRPSYCH